MVISDARRAAVSKAQFGRWRLHIIYVLTVTHGQTRFTCSHRIGDCSELGHLRLLARAIVQCLAMLANIDRVDCTLLHQALCRCHSIVECGLRRHRVLIVWNLRQRLCHLQCLLLL